MLKKVALAAGALLVSVGAGCNQGPFNADVKGTVTLDGKPVPPGVVIFSAAGGGRNSSRGRIESDGKYFLVTRHNRGIDAGDYRVAVQVYEKGDPPGPGERAPANLPPLVPEKYLSVDTSGLEYTVEPGSNTIDIAMTSDGGN
ncbi:hypothetical protein [Botrimarina mediterranea]|uniref:Carboxypeptidase regulatory-like domain-containing protein n=1 Tax=Botrimarina mediterranea TaxID=2528022 RepID=A0A518K7X5_9BACT|nr:hypothetical protein [Botrimarina mediterranea]QDV73885.1 hypothetical protein Spa11_20840 [Botrimarina mediterranea]QDV78515.1 hypothetical protein K2D_21220 [Planctomycetes bacterium K2D]